MVSIDTTGLEHNYFRSAMHGKRKMPLFTQKCGLLDAISSFHVQSTLVIEIYLMVIVVSLSHVF